ncbi:MAG: MATE family efflux transporter [Myxococcota bacterium]
MSLPPRTRRILDLALPIMGGMVSQNIMNLVDTGMVGSLGEAALAAVGMSSFATFMAQAFIMGLSSGVQAMSARRKGEGRESEMALPLNGGLLMAVALGLPISITLFALAPPLYPYLNDDPAVIEQGVPYFRARLCAVTVVGMNFAFRGYFNAVDLSRIYLRSLVTMHVANLSLNYVLIFGKLGAPALGSLGAGVGSAIATVVGLITYVFMAFRYARRAGFLRGLPDKPTLRTMLRLSLPSGVRQLFFAAGMTTLFWIVGRIGRAELAAATVLINVTLVAILPAIGLGMAAATLVGQALGKGDTADAEQWGWDVARIAVGILIVLGLPMAIAPHAILDVFTDAPATIEAGAWPLRIVGLSIGIDGVAMVLQNALLGAGDTRRVMVVGVGLQWLVFLPIAFLIGPVLGYGLVGVWSAQVVYRSIQAGLFAQLWRGGRWASIVV